MDKPNKSEDHIEISYRKLFLFFILFSFMMKALGMVIDNYPLIPVGIGWIIMFLIIFLFPSIRKD